MERKTKEKENACSIGKKMAKQSPFILTSLYIHRKVTVTTIIKIESKQFTEGSKHKFNINIFLNNYNYLN